MATSKKVEPGATVEQVLYRVVSRRPELEQLDNQIGVLIVRIEKALRDLKLGMRLSVSTGRGGDSHDEVLAFDKVNGSWRLILESGLSDDPETWSGRPLSDVDRRSRSDMLRYGHLEELLLGAERALNEELEDRRQALEAGTRFVDAVERLVGQEKTK
ncbi:MAG: hypothetical protein KBG48_31315 [Kofleriaceae bacterium]|jgi:hypothetical protein|nr:hypothetical protein [Kofleriaceae bacterium]MBP9171924.1 hypothetical protein [Kofleriaceae bacterium]MBP9859298.1 hypothetical protein [Kofleriaceae bacterium]